MKNFYRYFSFAALVVVLAAGSVLRAMRLDGKDNYGRMPIYFIENRGQVDQRVAYYTHGRDQNIYFTPEGLTFVISAPAVNSEATALRHVVKLDFVGAAGVAPAGQKRTPAVFNYFAGPADSWRTEVPAFESLIYKDVWPGIDLVYSGTADQLKYSFLVSPGADPSRIRLSYRGTAGLNVTAAGELEVSTPAGGFRDKEPYAYQDVDGEESKVTSAHMLQPRDADTAEYHFQLGKYDMSRVLVIDSASIVYSGFLGGNSGSVAVESAGHAYMTGGAGSVDFPVLAGPDSSPGGSTDVFVAKVNADGDGLVYAGFIGGSGLDISYGIAVSGSGEAYITGRTTSANLTTIQGPGSSYHGSGDAFAAKLNATGLLEYLGYIGGNGHDVGTAITVDASGQASIAGNTNSDQTFVAKLSPSGALMHDGHSIVPR